MSIDTVRAASQVQQRAIVHTDRDISWSLRNVR